MATEAASKSYELWDTDSGNAVGGFTSEHEALAAVRDAATRHGTEYVAAWALVRATARRVTAIAEGRALAERAVAEAPREARKAS
jgi:hypothetical protein